MKLRFEAIGEDADTLAADAQRKLDKFAAGRPSKLQDIRVTVREEKTGEIRGRGWVKAWVDHDR